VPVGITASYCSSTILVLSCTLQLGGYGGQRNTSADAYGFILQYDKLPQVLPRTGLGTYSIVRAAASAFELWRVQ
jgi:hypothetical protein